MNVVINNGIRTSEYDALIYLARFLEKN